MSLTEKTENSEEFIVCRDKVGYIGSVKGKIERLFGTRIYFNEVSKDGDKEKRWVRVTGGKWDRQNAKTYILGISEPEETKTVKCSLDFLDNEILENIEKNTQAVLENSSPNIKISGSPLAVTLALSALEDLTGCSNLDSSPSDTETRESSASKRLDEKLDETFGEGRNSYHSYPSSIKRLLLECSSRLDEDGEDVQEELLHGSGIETSESERKTVSEVLLRKKEEPDQRRNVTAPICRNNGDGGVSKFGNAGTVTDGERRNEVSTVTKQFPLAAQISPERVRNGQDEDFLRQFARNVGYTNEEVDEGFLYVTPPMKPTDFLDLLKTLKEGKQNLGLSEILKDASPTQDESVYVVSDEEEGDIMIVDDHFKKVDMKKPLSTKNLHGGLSNKQKKKNEQKQSDLAKQFEQQQNKSKQKNQPSPKSASSSDSVDSNNGKKNKKEGNSSGTKRKSDPDSDQEQTCVMKVWEPNQDMTSRDPRHNQPRQQRLVEYKDEAASATPPQTRRTPMMQQQQTLTQFIRQPPSHLLPQPVDTHFRIPEQGGVYPNQASHFNGNPVYSQQQRKQPRQQQTDNLRYVIIDGSNVAMFHGNSKVFSCKGIQIAVDFFLDRGHKVTVFIPEWRKYRSQAVNRIKDQELLGQLEDDGHLVFTPSRKIQGKLVASYDDRYILSLAEKEDSVILSNDQYRDLMSEKASWRKIVEERLLMYRFVGDHFMPAEDPLGRNGPMLDEFLQKHPTPAPQLPQRTHYQPQYQGARGMVKPRRFPIGHWQTDSAGHSQVPGQGQIHNGGQGQSPWKMREGQPGQRFPQPERPKRHTDVTEQLLSQLKNVFTEPWQEEKIKKVLDNHRSETDLNRLTNYCMEVIFK